MDAFETFQFIGINLTDISEEYIEKAKVMFEEMDLRWDLEQLEKVRSPVV